MVRNKLKTPPSLPCFLSSTRRDVRRRRNLFGIARRSARSTLLSDKERNKSVTKLFLKDSRIEKNDFVMKISRALLWVFCLAGLMPTMPTASHGGESNPAVGPGSVIVHSQFGGQIFGFDIDPNGNEGILSESKSLSGGRYLAAVETFDQTTGAIIKVVSMTETQDD